MTVNAWGQEIPEWASPDDLHYVAPDKRKDIDDDSEANALLADPDDPESADEDL